VVCYPTPNAMTCCTPWRGSVGCVNLPENQYLLKGTVWTGEFFKEEIHGSWSNLISTYSYWQRSRPPGGWVPENKLVTLGSAVAYVYLHVLHTHLGLS
jgi:hypothetical protein